MAKLSLQILAVVVLTLAAMQSLSVEADCGKMMDDFDLAKYAGTWYIYKMNQPFFPMKTKSKCGYFTYIVNDDTFLNGTYDYYQVGDQQVSMFRGGYRTAIAQLNQTDNNQYESIVYFSNGEALTKSSYTVLYTDYTSVSYVYSCKDGGYDQNNDFAFVLTRDPVSTGDQEDLLDNQTTTYYSPPMSESTLVDQVDDCPYLPEDPDE